MSKYKIHQKSQVSSNKCIIFTIIFTLCLKFALLKCYDDYYLTYVYYLRKILEPSPSYVEKQMDWLPSIQRVCVCMYREMAEEKSVNYCKIYCIISNN